MIKAIIFDLDSCLCAADEPGTQLFQPAFAAIEFANRGSHSKAELQQALADMWRLPFDFVAEKYGFTHDMREAGWQELLKTVVTQPLHGYGDLAALQELTAQLFLVTTGFRRLQESKIRALVIAPLFTEIHVDAIDEPNPLGKARIFRNILNSLHFAPTEILVVGDNPDSELAAGRRLGMWTVQTLRPGVPFSDNATYHIKSLFELAPLTKAQR